MQAALATNYSFAIKRKYRLCGTGKEILQKNKFVFEVTGFGAVQSTINDLEPNKTYYFKVRGGNGWIREEWSNEMKITIAKREARVETVFTKTLLRK